MSSNIKIAIVGGGLAGLAAAMKIAEAGHEVDLISVVPVKRSHSVCAQGGIYAASLALRHANIQITCDHYTDKRKIVVFPIGEMLLPSNQEKQIGQ